MLTDSPRSRVYQSKANTAITQFQFVMRDSSDEELIHTTANPRYILGIAMESRTATSGVKKDVTVALPGEMYDIKLGESVEAGDPLKALATGTAGKANAAADNVVARAFVDGTNGDIIPCRMAISGNLAVA